MIFVNDYSNMSTEIRLKRGTGIPSSLKEGEPAIDKTTGDLYVGLSDGTVKKVNSTDLSDVIKKGERDNSVILNDLKNNVAVNAYSIAEGSQTIAGVKGYKIISIDKINKKYTLNTVEGLSVSSDTLLSEYYYLEAMGFYIPNEDFGYITEIDKENKTITFNVMGQASQGDYIYNKLNPNVGDSYIGINFYSHAEGLKTQAVGGSSHSEGNTTRAIGDNSHAEGKGTRAIGENSHAEGAMTVAKGNGSHAEGNKTTASGNNSHSEGSYTRSIGENSHTEGEGTKAIENKAHAEGENTTASGSSSHAEGVMTTASGSSSHSEGMMTGARGSSSHAEGKGTKAMGDNSHVEGNNTSTGTRGFLIDKSNSSKENLCYQLSSVVGINNNDVGYIYTETKIYGPVDILSVGNTEANKNQIFVLSGTYYDFTEDIGYLIIAGKSNVGDRFVVGKNSHAEGNTTQSIGDNSHAEGNTTQAMGSSSHAEGENTEAIGIASHAEGYYTIAAADYQHVEGKYNIEDKEGKYLHITGNGFDTGASNAYTLDKHGNAWFSGNVKIGGDSYDNSTKELAVTEDLIGKKGTGNNSEVFNNLDKTAGLGESSHAEGSKTEAIGDYSHAEGENTKAIGIASHAEGMNTKTGRKAYKIIAVDMTNKKYTLSTVDGLKVNDILNGSVDNSLVCKIYDNFGKIIEIDTNNKTITVDVMCDNLKAKNYIYTKNDTLGDSYVMGTYSHVEGRGGHAYGPYSHAEGYSTKAYGSSSHSEGHFTEAQKSYAHSEGYKTIARGEASHAEGYQSIAGRKAYRIASVDSENKKYGLDIVTGISVDDILSGYNETNGIEKNFGKVTAVDTTNKTITVDVIGTVAIGDYLCTDDVTAGDTYILGEKAHAEGNSSYAVGENSHSEGNTTRAIGDNSHSEGWLSKASGKSAHAEGCNSKAMSSATHAEGDATEASGSSSHSEGSQTKAIGDVSHAEGMMTKAIGGGSHAEGGSTEAVGANSHAEGTSSQALGVHSHAEGLKSIAGGVASHVEGYKTQTGRKAFNVIALDSANKKYTLNTVEGLNVNDSLNCYELDGNITLIQNHFGKITEIDITNKTITVDKFYEKTDLNFYLFTENRTIGDVYIYGRQAHAEGYSTLALGEKSHAEGEETIANGDYSHAEGEETIATGDNSHSEGYCSHTIGFCSHAEGYNTKAIGESSHAEGTMTMAKGLYSHAEGENTEAIGESSHAEGIMTKANGDYSHAEGLNSITKGASAHAEGYNTIASGDYQHVEGKYNIEDTTGKYVHIVGNGTEDDNGDEFRSNAHTVDWQGNGWYQGNIKIGGTGYDDTNAKELATKEYVDSKAGGESSEAQYKTVALNEVVSEAVNGLTKFRITGLVVSAIHNPSHGNVLKKYVPLQHTKGTLNIVRNETNISSFDIDLYGRNANNTYGFLEAKDEINEMGYKRVWSNDFFITDTFDYTIETPANNSANRLHTFTIPASAFGDELPKKTGVIEPLCSFAQACSVEYMNSITDNVVSKYGKGYYIAMQYSSENNNYKVMFLTNAIDKSKLLAPKMFIKYELETPIYDRHINKIYIKNGDKFIFNQISVESFTTNNSTPGIAQVPITTDIKVPCNNKAVLDGFEQTTENINDLNKRIDNVEVNNTKIGSADGVTDDSDAIQKLIDSALDGTTGHVREVVIPDGEYALGKSIELTTSNIRLTGNGNVILKPTGRFPAIKIYRPSDTAVSDVQVDNITIYLSNNITSDSDDGLHSGIYVDGNNRGMYRVVLKNISIQGVYRYEIRDTDKSYGIYFKDINTETESTNNGFVYFPTIENCSAFSVMCGLYLGIKNNGSNVVDFHWDHGKNIYNVAGPLWSLFGVKYGIVCRSNLNTITFRGQAFGDNTLGLIYYDASNGTKYTLKEIVGENNCYTDTYGREFFNEGYEVTTALKHNNNIVYLRYDNLTTANIVCSGNTNFIQGQAYDPQRADNYIYFEKGSSYNRYYYPVNYMEFGTSQISTSNNCEVYGKGKGTIYMPMYREENLDFGFNNVAINQPLESQQESFVGDVYKYSPSSVGISKHFGMQDNALGYADKWCNVSVYQKNSNGEQVAVTVNNGVNASDAIGALFDPKSIMYGFDKGITFDMIPSLDNPIYIDIESDNVILSRWSRFILQFNENICQDFEIHSRILGSDWQTVNLGKATRNNTKAFYSRHLYDSARTGFQTYDNVTGIRIILNQAYSTDSYNTEKKVGLCLIYATDSNHGGNAWLPKGGGDLYGDINLNNNKITGINALEIKSSTTDSTNTFEVSIDDTGIITTKNGDMVKKVAEKVDSVDKTTETTISITSLADNSQLVYGSVNSINVGFPEPLSFDYMASISFTTPSTIEETYSTFPSDLYFKGDESEGGIFVPNPSTRYTILFYCDGVRRIGLVSGIEVSTT